MKNHMVRNVPIAAPFRDRQSSLCIQLGFLAALVTACSVEPEAIESASLPIALPGGLSWVWPLDPSNTVHVVPVCFEAGTIENRRLVQDEVEGKWGRYGNLAFTGWGNCPATSQGGTVRVYIHDQVLTGWSKASRLGYSPSEATHVDLNFWLTGYCSVESGTWGFLGNSDQCYRMMALHEFGHVLGFKHEQARPDNWIPSGNGKPTNPYCTELDPGGGDDPNIGGPTLSLGTPYDRNSVMNYCNHKDTELSAYDIIELQAVYGWRPSGNMVGRSGRNLDIQWSHTDNGTPTWIWENNGSAAQRWTYDVSQGTMKALGKCLDGTTTNGTQTFISDCGQRTNARWDFRDFVIRGFGAKCLDRVGGGTADGTKVQLRYCSGEGNQRWTYMSNSVFRTGAAGSSSKCLDTYPGTVGQQLYIGTCYEDDYQKFDLTSAGEIRVRATHLCLDVSGASKEDGTPIVLYSCKNDGTVPTTPQGRLDRLNQQFFFSTGSFFTSAGKCLDAWVSGAAGSNGIPTKINGSNGYRNQVWDYYFQN